MVCSSARHSQVVGEAIPHLYKQERKRPMPMRGEVKPDPRCSWEGHSGWVGAGVGNESVESCKVIRPLHIPLVVRQVRRAYVFVVRQSVELLCGGYKWVSRFEAQCICTR